MKQNTFVCTAALAFMATGLTTHADLVTDWNERALNAIRTERTAPPTASRKLAILHTAIYDALNGIKPKGEPYLVTERAHPGASKEAAVAAAAHKVLVTLFAPQAATFDAALMADLAAMKKGHHKVQGIAWGEAVAAAILASRTNDGSGATVVYTPGVNPGEWRPTISFGGIVRPALLPQWGFVTPFGVPSASALRPPPPPALDTAQYADEMNQVKEIGSLTSATRTADQTQIALFWANGAGTSTPPGHWNQIAQTLSAQFDNKLEENARLFALLNIALADAAIVSWDCKYAYNYWRPITAIQLADTDNNAATEVDAAWTPFLQTPPFPEYTSGHSTFSGAAAVVLASFFGSDEIPFVATSDDVPGVQRAYPSFSAAAEESGLSRIYGGIHFMSANVFGLDSGATIGEHVAGELLQLKHPKKPKNPKDPKPPKRLE